MKRDLYIYVWRDHLFMKINLCMWKETHRWKETRSKRPAIYRMACETFKRDLEIFKETHIYTSHAYESTILPPCSLPHTTYEKRPTTETNKYEKQSTHITHLYYSEILPPSSLPHTTYEKRPTTETYIYAK